MERKKVLIIEDDRNLSAVISSVLNQEGFSTIVAYTGQEGIKLALSGNPDIIILDIILPDIDGLEVLKRIKLTKEIKNIPIIMCTERGLLKDVESAFSLGASSYVIKPFEIEKLIKKVKELTSP